MIRTIKKSSIKLHKTLTLFLITDLHYYEKKDIKKYDFIQKQLQKEKPNYLLIGGDVLDNAKPKEAEPLLTTLKKWAEICPILIGLGNHDITTFTQKIKYEYNHSFWNKVKQIKGITLLDNQIFETDHIRIIGFTLPFSYYYFYHETGSQLKKSLNKTFSKSFSNDKLNILLIHSSLGFRNCLAQEIPLLNSIDLILSGHTHNGCVPKILEPIFRNRGFLSPEKHFFPHYVRGTFQKEHLDFIISGGITKLSNRSGFSRFDRFFAHEITKIVIDPKEH